MNVPNEIPTTSQMICLLVSHTIELYFELCTSSVVLRALNSGIACQTRQSDYRRSKHKAQSTKHGSDLYPHPWQHARLPFDLGSNFANARGSHSLIKTFGIRIG